MLTITIAGVLRGINGSSDCFEWFLPKCSSGTDKSSTWLRFIIITGWMTGAGRRWSLSASLFSGLDKWADYRIQRTGAAAASWCPRGKRLPTCRVDENESSFFSFLQIGLIVSPTPLVSLLVQLHCSTIIHSSSRERSLFLAILCSFSPLNSRGLSDYIVFVVRSALVSSGTLQFARLFIGLSILRPYTHNCTNYNKIRSTPFTAI